MKNIYIIALTKGNEPVFLQQRAWEDITYIGRCYKHAYIAETKKQADETRGNRYKTRVERKNDEKYPDFY